MTPTTEHVHTLRRATKQLYHCINNCEYVRAVHFLLGKLNKCPFCPNTWQLTREDLRRALPRCPDCTISKDKTKMDNLTEEIQQAMMKDEVPE